jgi:SAM-dependent methyltransferase
MDLRRYNLSAGQVARAKALFGYQPVILSDSVCTGVAYKWLHVAVPDAIGLDPFDRNDVGPEMFELALAANTRLIRTYEAYGRAICSLFPSGTYLDIACNTGFFPVFASLNGMRECVGLDPGDHADAVAFLNDITGANAEFVRGGYAGPVPMLVSYGPDGAQEFKRKFDVVSTLEFMCHLGDPLQFLQAVAASAKKAVFIWGGFLQSDELLIRLGDPIDYDAPGFEGLMWSRFCYATSISTRLLSTMMHMLGFPLRLEIAYPPDGLPPDWHAANLSEYQPHQAYIFVREPYIAEVRQRLGSS